MGGPMESQASRIKSYQEKKKHQALEMNMYQVSEGRGGPISLEMTEETTKEKS